MSWPKSVGSGIDGVVGLSEVVEVLRRHGVAVYPQEPGSSELVLKKGDLMEVHEFPPFGQSPHIALSEEEVRYSDTPLFSPS